MAFVSFAYDMIYGVSSNFFKSVFDSSKAKLYRYDLHSGLVDTLGSHDDMATCIGYSNETCNLLIPLFISVNNCYFLLFFHYWYDTGRAN